ncbi:MAG: NAD(P)-dependent oxidoreductase [Acidimicrobiales bacterium]|nr:NAD(P)-dependent oxidoreductase [Acidimicrobiales bacterium]
MEPEPSVGFLHPGAMGSVLAACCNTPRRFWMSPGRSAATVERAEVAGLRAVSSLSELAQEADMIVSVCPPAAASEVAAEVAATDFEGIFVDANAIAPAQTREIASSFNQFVDASIIGLPPTVPGATRLYLSGPGDPTRQVQRVWEGSLFDARIVGESVGAASALKMAYAGWTKGSMALLFTVVAAAQSEGLALCR